MLLTTLLPAAHVLEAEVGIAAPTGFVGLTYAADIEGPLQLEGGVGLGFSGVQLSLMPRLNFELSGGGAETSHRYVLGVGVSAGLRNRREGKDFDVLLADSELAHSNTLWLNIDVAGYEARFANGFVFAVGIGAAIGLTGRFYSGLDGIRERQPDPQEICYDTTGDQQTNTCYETRSILGLIMPQAHVSVGYAF